VPVGEIVNAAAVFEVIQDFFGFVFGLVASTFPSLLISTTAHVLGRPGVSLGLILYVRMPSALTVEVVMVFAPVKKKKRRSLPESVGGALATCSHHAVPYLPPG
jgi:hypothetical protein